MGTYIIMVGVPGSGKTTASKKLSKAYDAKIFSSDEYRKALLGTDTDQSQNAYIFECLYKDLKAYLKDGGNAILDATNMTMKGRRQSLEVTKGVECSKIAYVVNTPVSVCIERDAARERTVGEDVIWKFVKRFDFPCVGEGFDKILLDNPDGYEIVSNSEEDAVQKMVGFDQKNHHHTMTLDKHTNSVMSKYDATLPDYYAAKYHDVGKVYTQAIDESGEAHYYSHANVSAYWLTSHIGLLPDEVKDSVSEIILLINYHMRANDIFNSEKSTKKYTDIFGEHFMQVLRLFNLNDYSSK